MPGRIAILASGTPEEDVAIRLAAKRITEAIQDAGGPVVEIETAATAADIAIVSLRAAVDAVGEGDWPETARRLRGDVAKLQHRARRVYLCTVLRHAKGPDAPARLARIRKLNLLAIELSRELGAFVVDFDRALADAGARSFETDYRLSGPLAAQAAAHEIVRTLVATGFDASLPHEARARLKALLETWIAPRAAGAEEAPVTVDAHRDVVRNARAIGGAFSSSDTQAAFVLRQIALGQIPLRDALALGARMTRTHGFARTLTICMRGARSFIRGAKV